MPRKIKKYNAEGRSVWGWETSFKETQRLKVQKNMIENISRCGASVF